MIYIIRHTEKLHAPRPQHVPYAEHTQDIPLTQAGISRALRIADFFNTKTNVKKIITSPFRRTVQTAQIINQLIKGEVSVDQRLSERTLCSNHETSQQIRRYNETSLSDWSWRAPNGESMNDVAARLESVIGELDAASDHDILLVSHSRAIQAYAGITGSDNVIDYTSADPAVIIPYGTILAIQDARVYNITYIE